MKENTHLFFANSILYFQKNKNLKKIIEENKDYFLLGSVFPDVFYHNEKTSFLSKKIHGRGRVKTNELIFDFLNLAKENQDKKIFVFVLGYVSHYVLDTEFHPVIYYLTGNYYDEIPQKRYSAMLRHRQLETIWDKKITDGFHLCKEIDIQKLNDLDLVDILDKKYNFNKEGTLSVFKQCRRNNKLFRKYWAYLLLKIMIHTGLYKNKSVIGFFLHSKNKELEGLGDEFEARDLFSGRKYKVNLEEMLISSRLRALDLFSLCFSYYKGEKNSKELESGIPGESLNTGTINTSSKDIVYTRYM